jgi:heme/copper-type cytochrome/quinol oxidase subunit 2
MIYIGLILAVVLIVLSLRMYFNSGEIDKAQSFDDYFDSVMDFIFGIVGTIIGLAATVMILVALSRR